MFTQLWNAIDVLEAQEQLAIIKAFQFPNLTKQKQSELNKKLLAQAYPRTIYKRQTKDVKSVLKMLGGFDGR